MPIDKQTKASTTIKPVTPALSSRFRNHNPGLQPRLAGSAPTSPAVTARKDLRAQTLSPSSTIQTPPLSVNITPRSGKRNSRIGTESPATPGSTRRLSGNGVSQQARAGSPASSTAGQNRLATSNTTTTIHRKLSGSSSISRKDEQTTKFARAAEARPVLITSKSLSNVGSRPRVNGFVRTGTAPQDVNTPPGLTLASETNEEDGRFFRANDVPKNTYSRPVRPPMSTSRSLASVPAIRSGPLEVSNTRPSVAPPVSPKKSGPLGLYDPVSPRKPPITQPSLINSPDNPGNRRASIGSSSTMSRQSHTSGHKKAISVSTISQATVVTSPATRLQTQEPAWTPPTLMHIQTQRAPIPLVSPDALSPRSASLASSKTATTSVTSDTDHSEISRIFLTPKDGHCDTTGETGRPEPRPPPQSEAQISATNARRERKVLDLEISNSSLLAINKTLERELKKQSTELRRFRRLSRAGRFSIAPTDRSVSIQSVLTTLSEHSEEEDQDISEEETESEPSTLDDGDDSLLSNDSEAIRTNRRARDERRLMLDLSKHQQLLIDSQKMSTSMKKCLNLTEELIREGNKALEYKVGIGDLKLGGRVLSNEDYEHDTDAATQHFRREEGKGPSRQGLLSPSLIMTGLHEATSWLVDLQVLDGNLDSKRDQQQDPPD